MDDIMEIPPYATFAPQGSRPYIGTMKTNRILKKALVRPYIFASGGWHWWGGPLLISMVENRGRKLQAWTSILHDSNTVNIY